jgi:hypothetical protein
VKRTVLALAAALLSLFGVLSVASAVSSVASADPSPSDSGPPSTSGAGCAVQVSVARSNSQLSYLYTHFTNTEDASAGYLYVDGQLYTDGSGAVVTFNSAAGELADGQSTGTKAWLLNGIASSADHTLYFSNQQDGQFCTSNVVLLDMIGMPGSAFCQLSVNGYNVAYNTVSLDFSTQSVATPNPYTLRLYALNGARQYVQIATSSTPGLPTAGFSWASGQYPRDISGVYYYSMTYAGGSSCRSRDITIF